MIFLCGCCDILLFIFCFCHCFFFNFALSTTVVVLFGSPHPLESDEDAKM